MIQGSNGSNEGFPQGDRTTGIAQARAADRVPVVFLPGLLCDEAVWKAQIVALDDRALCSVPDYEMADSLPSMAESVLASAPPEFAVVGHSMGGRVALEVFRQARKRVRRLALLDTGYQAREFGKAGEGERAQRMELVKLGREKGMRAMGSQWVQDMVHPDRLNDEPLIGAILDMIERKTAAIFEAQQRALLARPEAGPLLSEIRCPTLILCGREDAWSPPSRHEEMARRIEGSQLAVIERCGHMSTMERPDEVNGALRAWLAW